MTITAYNFDRFLSESCSQPEWVDIFDEENNEWIHIDAESTDEVRQRAKYLLGIDSNMDTE